MSNKNFDIIKKNIESLSVEINLTEKDVILFGVNTSSFEMFRCLRKNTITPKAFIDNNLRFSGKTYLGVKADTPEAVLGKNYNNKAVILITSRYFNEMKKQLVDMGYTEKQIYQIIKYEAYDTKLSSLKEAEEDLWRGVRIYQRLRNNFGEEKKIMICPYAALGDAYFIARYLDAYCKVHEIRKFVLVIVGNTCKRIVEMCGIEEANIRVLNQKESDELMNFVAFIGEKKLNAAILTHCLVPFERIMYHFDLTGSMDWGTMFRRVVLDLPEEAKPHYNNIEKNKEQLILLSEIRNKLYSSKSVIISPYANTLADIEYEFWENMVVVLKRYGYQVYTNSRGEDEPAVAGSEALTFPLEIAKEVIEAAGVFIGVRSGFCEIIEDASAEIFVLYPDEKSLFFSLKSMGFGGDVAECIYSEIWKNERWLNLTEVKGKE